MKRGERIVGVDIGSTKICTVIGEISKTEKIEITGVGLSPSVGLKKGAVVNIDTAIRCIKNSISEAEQMAGISIDSVFVGITGGHIKGTNSHGVITISRGREITSIDVDRVIEAAKSVALPFDRELIHILPQQFIIDGQDGIKNPIGMTGTRLEVELHIITGATTMVQNIIKCINKAGYTIEGIVIESLAAAAAVVSEDEKNLGIALIDIGGGTTDIAVFIDGSVNHIEILSIGGDNVTKDISVGLRTSFTEAERIKKEHGACIVNIVDENEIIELPSFSERRTKTFSRRALAEIIEPRMEEILSLAYQEIKTAGYENLISAGIVLSGGSVMLEGITELAERIFDLPAQINKIRGIEGLVDMVSSPIYSTAVGLVMYGMKEKVLSNYKKRGRLRRVTIRVKDWFKEIF